jgi:phospholipid/cholesterol/gamma-HCH transport system substrate-binding protein
VIWMVRIGMKGRILKNRAIEFWVGLFTLLGVGLALFMIYRTGDLRFEREPGYNVHVDFTDVAGLDVGDTVRVAGVEVGKVERIDLEENQGRVMLLVDHQVALYEDAAASIKAYGLLGGRFVSLDPGHSRLPRLGPNGTVHAAVSEDDLNVLLGKLSGVSSDIKSVTENLSKVFGGAEGEEALRAIMLNTKDLSRNLAQMTAENREQFKEITVHLAGLTGELQAMVSENREALQKTVATLPETAENIRSITGDTRRLLQDHGEDISETLKQLRLASASLDTSLKNMEAISEQIRSGEGTLGKLIYDAALYEEATNTIREARNLVEDMREQAPISAFIAVGGAAF